MGRKLRIGTRTSLMAMAQAKTVARLLQARHPELECELVGINSSGDKDKTTPLWQMNVVGIFSRELDEQLLAGEVDCVVHSFKDLGTERPEGLTMAALLPRDNPRDIALFRPDVLEKLARGEELCIGSSSPRRMVQVPEFLAQALPQVGTVPPRIRVETLRGNANSRIEKLKKHADSVHFDGIVLALAGLNRLLNDDVAAPITRELLAGLKIMVLPLTMCPTAPGQGLVCVEARTEDASTQELLAPLHHEQTAAQVKAERDLLLRHGGGCHQRFGATQLHLPNLAEPVMLVRGENKDGARVDEDIWQAPALPPVQGSVWDGQRLGTRVFEGVPIPAEVPPCEALFITHARALPEATMPQARVWVSGIGTWFKLAARGVWVEGCGDSFGIDFLRETLTEPALNLPPLEEWKVLTHADALGNWRPGQAIATYTLQRAAETDALAAALQQATIAWWGSGTQYELMASQCAHIKMHACGAGRTAATLRAHGISPMVFPSHAVFCQWLAAQGMAAVAQREAV